MERKDSNLTYEHTYEMLLYYQDEFMHRHTHFWSTLKSLFLINVIVTMLPYISSVFDVELAKDQLPLFIFPVVGALMAVGCLFLLLGEAKRLSLVGKNKYELMKLLPEEYRYRTMKPSRMRLPSVAIMLCYAETGFQLLVAALSLYFCL